MNTYNIILLVSALVILGLSIWAFMTRCNIDKFGDDYPYCPDVDKNYKCQTKCPSSKTINPDTCQDFGFTKIIEIPGACLPSLGSNYVCQKPIPPKPPVYDILHTLSTYTD